MADKSLVYEPLNLDNLRCSLIRQEETIIFAIIERSQFLENSCIYDSKHLQFSNTGVELKTEKVHSKIRRYTSPDEHPFFPWEMLPEPILPHVSYPVTIVPNTINVNNVIKDTYIKDIVSKICKGGDDGNHGSSALCDVQLLQALSKRIHYGKFVAEVKYLADPERFAHAIENQDSDELWSLITDEQVEEQVLQRILVKASAYGEDPTSKDSLESSRKIIFVDPNLVRSLYETFIIPLTKQVQVQYLLQRRRTM